MNCQLEFVRQDGERFIHRCTKCGVEVRSKYRDPAMRNRQCGSSAIPPPTNGPGSEFFKICRELNVQQKPGCDCERLRREMDEGGVDYCREHRDCLLGRLQKHLEHYTLWEKAAAAWAALKQGKPLTLEGLVDLAIQRAAAQSESAP